MQASNMPQMCDRSAAGEQGGGKAAMSSATADTYPESVGSCPPPTPPTSPPPHPAPPPAPRGAPVRRQLDFGAGAGAAGDLEDDVDFLIRAVDDIERSYNEAKRRAPPCVCGRGNCAVERDEQREQWMYVCSSRPKCKHLSLCQEVDLNPKSPPGIKSDPKLSNPCVINTPSTHVPDARTPINNVNLRGAGAITLINVSPQTAAATTPFKYTSQGVGAATPIHVSPQGAGITAAVEVARSEDKPICRCTAGKCKVLRVGNEDFYGQGACSYKLPLLDAFKEPPQTGDNNIMGGKHLKDSPVDKEANGSTNPVQPNDDEWPFDIIDDEIMPTAHGTARAEVHQESPNVPCQTIAMTKTPTKSPGIPYGTHSPMTPCPNDICYKCHELGHWASDCPSSPRGCFKCGMVGHYIANCPQLRGSQKQ
ncbi:hypothetical protein BS78_K135900 [Paspalum vaginatum]|uniref:CCHC-type domain-containing protein n=1 Tax=Paspalum vaginatum TaxID=158149 RepID=A0A9W8CFL0_9POAL|nr:hypothetical protein BS78_K135900 [Paspalum vaginatum]